MKILLVSDTHERTKELLPLLERYATEVQLVIHLGDHAGDLLQYQRDFPQLNMVAVLGNCDYGPPQMREEILTIHGKRLLLTHGHTLGVKEGHSRLALCAQEKGVHAAFYGHTHIGAVHDYKGILIMNPGSPCFPRGGSKASYGIVEISEDGELLSEVILI